MIERYEITVPEAGTDVQIQATGVLLVVEESPGAGADAPLVYLGSRDGDGLRMETLARYGTCTPFDTVWLRGTEATEGETVRFFVASNRCYRAIVPQPKGQAWEPLENLAYFVAADDENTAASVRDPETGANLQEIDDVGSRYDDVDVAVNFYPSEPNDRTGLVLFSARYGPNNWPRGRVIGFNPSGNEFGDTTNSIIYGASDRFYEGVSIESFPTLRLSDTVYSVRAGEYTGSTVTNQQVLELTPTGDASRRPIKIRTDEGANTLFVTLTTENNALRRYTLDTLEIIDTIENKTIRRFDLDRPNQKVYYRNSATEVWCMNYDGSEKELFATLPSDIQDVKLLRVANPDTVWVKANDTVYAIEIRTGRVEEITSFPGRVFQPVPTVEAESR